MTNNAIGTTGGVRALLRTEGLVLLAAALAAYAATGASWRLFAVLILAPDLSFACYLAGARAGAFGYNAVHSSVGPILLALASAYAGVHGGPAVLVHALPVALIWLAHIGFDRALGYGLKYASGFNDTHLGRTGTTRRQSRVIAAR